MELDFCTWEGQQVTHQRLIDCSV